MIVNIETRNALNAQGQISPMMIVSYVDKAGDIQCMKYSIPNEQLYNWAYATSPNSWGVDPIIRSWDNKAVRKEPLSERRGLDQSRLHEIILDIIKAYPPAAVLHELNYPRTGFCDIEVDVDDDGFPSPEDARNPINTISWVYGDMAYVFGRAKLSYDDISWIQKHLDEDYGHFKTKYTFVYVYHESEAELLEDFFRNYLHKMPCVTGWNFFGYDWPYLFNRCRNLGIDLTYLSPTGAWFNHTSGQKGGTGNTVILPKHKMIYDYMEVYAKWDRAVNPKESNKLDWVAEKVLNVKKVVHELGFKEFWRQKPKEYVFYNAVDSILVKEIDAVIKSSSAYFGLTNLMHVEQLTAFSPVSSLHVVQAERQYEFANKVFPKTKKVEASGDDSYEGAYVYDPNPGVYRNVIALDYASLYPTTMRQFNISPDTFIAKDVNHKISENEIGTASGAYYKRDEEGFVPKILTDFYAQRKVYKKEMMIAIDEKYHLMEILERREKESKV